MAIMDDDSLYSYLTGVSNGITIGIVLTLLFMGLLK